MVQIVQIGCLAFIAHLIIVLSDSPHVTCDDAVAATYLQPCGCQRQADDVMCQPIYIAMLAMMFGIL